ncbi:MAG: adenylosuccinate synthetase, partial [Cyanobacteria bacterium]|nr:adenylosuccinate synthetase [Cyanobacteriota bacterium]
TTTGRKRRCGWFDAVIGKYSVQVNGLDSVAITKLDIFDGLKEIKVCVAYQDAETGEMIPHFPGQLSTLKKASPVYQTFPGWQGSVKEVRNYDGLPKEAKHYLLCLSELIGTPISIVSVGANREQTIMIENPLKGKSQSMDRPLKSVHDSSKKVSEPSETKHPSFT